MSINQFDRHRRPRPGVILVVVVACLALFLSVGIAFVFYAGQQAVSMRYQREASNGGRRADVNQYSRGYTDEAPPSAVDLFNLALSQLIYGAPDDETGYYSAMRGHELARGIYGGNWFSIVSAIQGAPDKNGNPTVVITTATPNGFNAGQQIVISGAMPPHYNGTHTIAAIQGPNSFTYVGPFPGPGTSFGIVQSASCTPYDGFGRVHYTLTSPELSGQDAYKIVNYTRFATDTVIRYPERETGVYIAKNAPYTYPDENNMFLAVVRPSDGKVLAPSFHRPWLTGQNGLTASTFGNQYFTLRAPLPAVASLPSGAIQGYGAMQNFAPNPATNVPGPDGSWGDVENLPGKAQQQYDSIWMDLDAPVHMWRGQLYKPLFAFLVMDLDGRINVNTAGNLKGAGSTMTSNEGWGPWEVNLNFALGAQAANVLLGSNGTTPQSRFGTRTQPVGIYSLDDTAAPPTAPGWVGVNAPFYSVTDLDSSQVTNGPGQLSSTLQQYYTSPTYPASNANGSANGATGERDNHPMLYNPYYAILNTTTIKPTTWQYNESFSPWEMFYLNSMINCDTVNYPLSTLGQFGLNPQLGLATNITANRLQFTTISNDLQRPGMRPWVWQNPNGMSQPAAAGAAASPLSYSRYMYNQAAGLFSYAPQTGFAVGGPINSPTPGGAAPNSVAPPSATDFDAAWRSDIATGLGAIDLNRKLSDYRVNAHLPFQHAGNITAASAKRAIEDRQQLAKDIYYRLLVVTGVNGGPLALPGGGPNSTSPEYFAARRLAQLAVNIVDFIDNDDFMTPFQWDPTTNPNEILFGTELPRLVINEACVRVRNNPNDKFNPGPAANAGVAVPKQQATMPYQMELFFELHNPLTPPNNTGDPNLSFGGEAPLVCKDIKGKEQSVYQLVIEEGQDANVRDVTNLTGAPNFGAAGNNSPNGIARQPNPQFAVLSNGQPPTPANVTVLGNLSFLPMCRPYLSKQGNYLVKWSNATKGAPPTAPGQPGSNPSFIVVGPPETAQKKKAVNAAAAWTPGSNPGSSVPLTLESNQLQANVPGQQAATAANMGNPQWDNVALPTLQANNLTILLQRLACPFLPHSPTNNPYVTVDYFGGTAAGLTIWDSRQYTTTSPNTGAANTQTSSGRMEPYTATSTFWAKQTIVPGWSNAIQAGTDANQQGFSHTFYQHNSNAPASFDWLVHLDRALISPIELFCVSAWKPHELTQQFCIGPAAGPARQQHLVQWNGTMPTPTSLTAVTPATNTAVGSPPAATNANDVRLYRALELLEVRGRTLGQAYGGRVPGLVNINTIWDSPVAGATTMLSPTFSALCAANNAALGVSSNLFTQANVDNIWKNLLVPRKATILPATTAVLTLPAWTSPSMTDIPFVPPAANYNSQAGTVAETQLGIASNRSGIQQTLLGLPGLAQQWATANGATSDTTMFPQAHPYLRNELLSKIFNSTTTRSNTFAVYCTIGYFQVTNPGPYNAANRPVLGQELGVGDGTNIRHKFFALVDRTNLTIESANVPTPALRPRQGQRPVFLSYEPLNDQGKNGPAAIPAQDTAMIPYVADPDTAAAAKLGKKGSQRVVAVRVPATAYSAGKHALEGVYDGQPWVLTNKAQILLDIGPKQEIATVLIPPGSFTGPNHGAKIVLVLPPSGAITHERGCVMQLNYQYADPVHHKVLYHNMLGNPGPQPSFNYKDPRYVPVVPVAVQIK